MDETYSSINQIALVFTLAMGVLILFLPRRFAFLPILMTACYVTLGQVMFIGPLHFTMIRIIIFFGYARIILRKEISLIMLHRIDKIFIFYVLTSATTYYLLRRDSEAIINQLGFIYNAGLYFIFRSLVCDLNDVYRIFKVLAFIMVPLTFAMIIEKATGRNFFAIFGGVPEITMVREGKIRCQGAFSHPILAGTFGATSLPFFVALWIKGNEYKLAAVVGIISATIITVTPASSGPVIAYIVVIIGLCMWRYRTNMREIRWLTLIILLMLHLVMKAPVWALIGKVSELIGGTGWHRVMLIDAAIEHFSEWWLLGTDYTRHWLPTGVTWSEKHTDITNQFIGEGIHGGVFSLILFITAIVYCYKNIGIILKKTSEDEFPVKFMIWCLGVSLSSHIASFLSVRYFDQIIVFWYVLLAIITSLGGKGKQHDEFEIDTKVHSIYY
jgi:hypothetical protein